MLQVAAVHEGGAAADQGGKGRIETRLLPQGTGMLHLPRLRRRGAPRAGVEDAACGAGNAAIRRTLPIGMGGSLQSRCQPRAR